MKNLGLSGWAAIAEIVAGIGVVISLLVVAYTVQQNTIALESGRDDMIYQAVRDLQIAQTTSPELANAIARMRQDESLSATQVVVWEGYQTLHLNIWENAFIHWNDGLIDDDVWNGWDKYFVAYLSDAKEGLSIDTWTGIRDWYEVDFVTHVENSLYKTD